MAPSIQPVGRIRLARLIRLFAINRLWFTVVYKAGKEIRTFSIYPHTKSDGPTYLQPGKTTPTDFLFANSITVTVHLIDPDKCRSVASKVDCTPEVRHDDFCDRLIARIGGRLSGDIRRRHRRHCQADRPSAHNRRRLSGPVVIKIRR